MASNVKTLSEKYKEKLDAKMRAFQEEIRNVECDELRDKMRAVSKVLEANTQNLTKVRRASESDGEICAIIWLLNELRSSYKQLQSFSKESVF